MKKDLVVGRREVRSWFNNSIRGFNTRINLYFEPHQNALKSLVEDGTIKEFKVGKVEIGYIYKNHLLHICEGSGDCFEEILKDMGEIE